MEAFQRFLAAHPDKQTVDELLPVLSKELPDNLRGRYLLIHRSQSLQFASLEFPRIILFSDDAKFILALTGTPEHASSNSMEVIQYNDSREAFDFYRIDYGAEGWEFEENPAVCRTCHGPNPRPNFEGYNLWPGAYGALDDEIIINTPEAGHFRKFIETHAGKGRYELLRGVPKVKELENIESGKYFLSIDREVYSHIYSDNWIRDKDIDTSYKKYPRSNYKFTQESGRLAVRQFARRMTRDQKFLQIKPAVLAALDVKANDLLGLIPKELIKNPDLKYEEYVEQGYKALYSHRLSVVKEALKFAPPPKTPFEVIEDRIWKKEPYPLGGDEIYRSLYFQSVDYLKAARLKYLYDSMGEPLDLKELSTVPYFAKGHSFTFGNSGIKWLEQAIQYFTR